MALCVRDETDTFDICDADLDVEIDGDLETFYTLRPIPAKVRRSFEATCTTKKKDGGRIIEQLDDRKLLYLLLDYAIVDWRGIVFKSTGQPVPCTKEFKEEAIDLKRQAAIFRLVGVWWIVAGARALAAIL